MRKKLYVVIEIDETRPQDASCYATDLTSVIKLGEETANEYEPWRFVDVTVYDSADDLAADAREQLEA